MERIICSGEKLWKSMWKNEGRNDTWQASSRADDRWMGTRSAKHFSHILNSLEQKVQDMAMHTSTMKEMRKCLERLCAGSNNRNKVYNVVQELFRGEKGISLFTILYILQDSVWGAKVIVFDIYKLEKDVTSVIAIGCSYILGWFAIWFYVSTTTGEWEFSCELIVGNVSATS